MTSKIRIDDLVESVSLYVPRHVLLHGYLGPFLIIYILWAYLWIVSYGVSEYFEAGLITVAGIGIIQILICLCCHWSVHVRCLLSCHKVS